MLHAIFNISPLADGKFRSCNSIPSTNNNLKITIKTTNKMSSTPQCLSLLGESGKRSYMPLHMRGQPGGRAAPTLQSMPIGKARPAANHHPSCGGCEDCGWSYQNFDSSEESEEDLEEDLVQESGSRIWFKNLVAHSHKLKSSQLRAHLTRSSSTKPQSRLNRPLWTPLKQP